MSTNVEYPCLLCKKDVINDAIQCSICLTWLHRNCAKLSKTELRKLSNDNYHWFCIACKNIFPFQSVLSDELEFITSNFESNSMFELTKRCKSYELDSSKQNKNVVLNVDLDPDVNFFNDKLTENCYYTDDAFKKNIQNVHGLSILHVNCRSIKSCFANLKDYISSLEYDFQLICISESWLNDDNVHDLMLDNYNVEYKNRANKRGGGVMIYINKKLDYQVCDELTESIDNIHECISIELQNGSNKNVIISCIYRAPGNSIDLFNEQIVALFNKVNFNKTYYLVGDLNINLLNSETHSPSRDFVDLLFSKGMIPLINNPTRITCDSATLIDNIFTNCIESKTNGILINDISDHLPIFTISSQSIKTSNKSPEARYKRVTKIENLNNFANDLQDIHWEQVLDNNNVDKAYDSFINTIQSRFELHCPIKKVKNKNITRKPWLTNGLLNAFKKQKTLYKRFLRCRTKESEIKYKNYKNKLTSIKRLSEKQYFSNLLAAKKNDIKATWNILNTIINKRKPASNYPDSFQTDSGTKMTSKKEIANKFNDFFVNVGPNLAKDIRQKENISIHKYMDPPNASSMFLTPVTETEILNIVNQCKSKTSADVNNLSMKITKHIIKSVVKPFNAICNLSFTSGVVPEAMKISKIVPLFKSGDKTVFTNYRPVALLPQFSKILEKLFCKRLNSFIDKNNILSENQYGFRANRSTSTALLDLLEEITKAHDENKHTIGVFIDLRKAFDTIDHDLLLEKLDNFGVRGTSNNWLNSYLKNRKQFVSLNNTSSSLSQVLCGVPQGSVLGPILFILYINDICNVSKLLRLILFADDTNLFRSGNNVKELSCEISSELSKLDTWFAVNKLSLNVAKTNFIVFSGKKSNNDIKITINNQEIERVYSTKFLGVIIDAKLTWKEHIATIRVKLSKCLAILFKSSKILEKNALRTLYCSLVMPYLNY